MFIQKTILRKSSERTANLRYWIRIARDSQTSNKASEIELEVSTSVNKSIAEPSITNNMAEIRKAGSPFTEKSVSL